MNKKIIFSIVGIIIVLAVVFLSQQAYLRGIGKTIISDTANQAKAYLADGSNLITSTIYPKVSGEVQSREDMIKNEVNQEKNKVSENIGTKISNYISGVVDSVLGKSNSSSSNQNCPSVKTQSN